jgi:hypothetical protein
MQYLELKKWNLRNSQSNRIIKRLSQLKQRIHKLKDKSMEDIQNEKMENKECFIYKKYKYIFICGIFCIYYIFVSDSDRDIHWYKHMKDG